MQGQRRFLRRVLCKEIPQFFGWSRQHVIAEFFPCGVPSGGHYFVEFGLYFGITALQYLCGVSHPAYRLESSGDDEPHGSFFRSDVGEHEVYLSVVSGFPALLIGVLAVVVLY